jgi:hypothetical protein
MPASIIMIEVPDHLVGHFKVCQERQLAKAKPTIAVNVVKIDPSERGPLSYVAGKDLQINFKLSSRKVSVGKYCLVGVSLLDGSICLTINNNNNLYLSILSIKVQWIYSLVEITLKIYRTLYTDKNIKYV